MITWNDKIEIYNDDIIYCSLSVEELDKEFDTGFGGTCGKPFIAFSKDWVYFPHAYDGSETIQRVPRSPSACKRLKYKPVHIGW